MTTINDIAAKVAEENGLTKAQAKSAVEAVFKAVTDAAIAGEETSIPGFGKFKVKETAEREGRNPATGATIKIAASKAVRFRVSKPLKDAVNG